MRKMISKELYAFYQTRTATVLCLFLVLAACGAMFGLVWLVFGGTR